MQPEIGKIYDGKVKGITKYGAFVEIAEGVTGMVHISEISNTFVNEIREVLTENQEVKVKVLAITEEGKVSLSIKKAVDNPRPQQRQQRFNSNNGNRNDNNGRPPYRNNDNRHSDNRNYNNNGGNNNNFKSDVWENKKTVSNAEISFEDMLNKFKQNSEEKMGDIKRNMENKRKNTSRRGR